MNDDPFNTSSIYLDNNYRFNLKLGMRSHRILETVISKNKFPTLNGIK